jgi:MFS family permease
LLKLCLPIQRDEQPLRFAIWYSANGLGSILGGLLGYGVGFITVATLSSWAWIFLLNGLITVLAGVAFVFVCPDSPSEAHFLTSKEREIALERVRGNQSSIRGYKTWVKVVQSSCEWG